MIKEAYCSDEVSLLLQAKGFPQTIEGLAKGIFQESKLFVRPTHQAAMKWLREEMNIFIDICTLSPMAYIYRVCLINDTTGSLYEDYACEEGERFMSYEEAVEAALKYCLTNLI